VFRLKKFFNASKHKKTINFDIFFKLKMSFSRLKKNIEIDYLQRTTQIQIWKKSFRCMHQTAVAKKKAATKHTFKNIDFVRCGFDNTFRNYT
jgi:hypothetical protein